MHSFACMWVAWCNIHAYFISEMWLVDCQNVFRSYVSGVSATLNTTIALLCLVCLRKKHKVQSWINNPYRDWKWNHGAHQCHTFWQHPSMQWYVMATGVKQLMQMLQVAVRKRKF